MTKKSSDRLNALIREWVGQQKNNTFNYKQVSHGINAGSPMEQRAVALALAGMAFDGELQEVSPG